MNPPSEKTQPNNFVRVAIALLALSLACMVAYRFVFVTPQGTIDAGVLSVIGIIVVLVLSESFDSFSVGKLLSISREVAKKDKEIDGLEKERLQLIKQLVTFNASLSQNQTIVHGTYNAPAVSRATEKEIEEKKNVDSAIDRVQGQEGSANLPGSISKTTQIPSEATQGAADQARSSRLRMNWGKASNIALQKYLGTRTSDLGLIHEVRLVERDLTFDPVSSSAVIFDAYFKESNNEVFVEVKSVNSSPVYRDRLYVMLSKVYHYKLAKRVDARLDLVLITIPGESERFGGFDRILRDFEPAMISRLLTVHPVTLTEEEAASCNETRGN